MTSSRSSVSAKKQRQRRKCKKQTVEEEEQTVLSFYKVLALMLTLITSHILSHFRFHRGEEVHRVRKHLERDIFQPLGKRYFRRAYRMDKKSFYVLHEILKEDLEKHFFPKQGGTRCHKTNTYLIRTEIRLSLALRFLQGLVLTI
jgi:hypothetical protein